MRTLDRSRAVLVQAHDFPDHDAIASAHALAALLSRKGFNASACASFQGNSISASIMIDRLAITLHAAEHLTVDEGTQTILVDGSCSGGTVSRVVGTLTGIIDHHPGNIPQDCPFTDIRVEAGSCSAIIWSYWHEAGENPDKKTATALLSGIQLDTDFLTRHVSALDLEAHYRLFPLGDAKLAQEVVKTSLSTDQLYAIGRSLSSAITKGDILAAELSGDYSSELLSVIADFLLRLREVSFVLVIEVRGEEYRLSARNRDPLLDAGVIVARALEGIGTGGGHPHMAGGLIKPEHYPGAQSLLDMIAHEIDRARSSNDAKPTKN